METTECLRVSNMPSFISVRHFLKILDGLPTQELAEMEQVIEDFGKQKELPLDWTEPKSWINDLPTGKPKRLAKQIWGEFPHPTNPRYLQSERSLISKYNLAIMSDGVFTLTKNGREFIKGEKGTVVLEIDRSEGTIPILTSLVLGGTSKSSEILPKFEQFAIDNGNQTPKSIYGYLNSRLNNLVARDYVDRSGNFYDISTRGRRYLEELDPDHSVTRIAEDAKNKKAEAIQRLQEKLQGMDAYKFENLVAELFSRMGYKNVEHTRKSWDGGVDVVAENDFGFGDEKVVIQAKRRSTNIDRSVVDQLRADMESFPGATRGIIVTTSDFNPNATEDANRAGKVRINLINREELLGLMIENQLGIHKEEVIYYEYVPSDLDFQDDSSENNE